MRVASLHQSVIESVPINNRMETSIFILVAFVLVTVRSKLEKEEGCVKYLKESKLHFVCGSDGRIYENYEELLRAKCITQNEDLHVAPLLYCTQPKSAKPVRQKYNRKKQNAHSLPDSYETELVSTRFDSLSPSDEFFVDDYDDRRKYLSQFRNQESFEPREIQEQMPGRFNGYHNQGQYFLEHNYDDFTNPDFPGSFLLEPNRNNEENYLRRIVPSQIQNQEIGFEPTIFADRQMNLSPQNHDFFQPYQQNQMQSQFTHVLPQHSNFNNEQSFRTPEQLGSYNAPPYSGSNEPNFNFHQSPQMNEYPNLLDLNHHSAELPQQFNEYPPQQAGHQLNEPHFNELSGYPQQHLPQGPILHPYQQQIPQPYQQVPQPYQQQIPQPYQQEIPQPYQQVPQPYQQQIPQPYQQVPQPYQQQIPQHYQQQIPQPYQQQIPQSYQQQIPQPYQQIYHPYDPRRPHHFERQTTLPYDPQMVNPYQYQILNPYYAQQHLLDFSNTQSETEDVETLRSDEVNTPEDHNQATSHPFQQSDIEGVQKINHTHMLYQPVDKSHVLTVKLPVEDTLNQNGKNVSAEEEQFNQKNVTEKPVTGIVQNLPNPTPSHKNSKGTHKPNPKQGKQKPANRKPNHQKVKLHKSAAHKITTEKPTALKMYTQDLKNVPETEVEVEMKYLKLSEEDLKEASKQANELNHSSNETESNTILNVPSDENKVISERTMEVKVETPEKSESKSEKKEVETTEETESKPGKKDVETTEETGSKSTKKDIETTEETDSKLSKKGVETTEGTDSKSAKEVETTEETDRKLSKKEDKITEETDSKTAKKEVGTKEETGSKLAKKDIERTEEIDSKSAKNDVETTGETDSKLVKKDVETTEETDNKSAKKDVETTEETDSKHE